MGTIRIIPDERNVKVIGRTHLLEDNSLLCVFSGSGIEFVYEGKELRITLRGDSTANEANIDTAARVAVYIDDVKTNDVMLTESETNLTIVKQDTVTKSRIKILKLSEAANSVFAIEPIEIMEGETVTKTSEKGHRIEFIGDSITCGYGVDDEDKEHHFFTKTEDATKAYAYKTACRLDADYSLVSFSGHGIISGYTDNPEVKTDQILPPYYEKLGMSYNYYGSDLKPQNLSWDFSKFQPELVVINLGTNDDSYCKGDADKQRAYIDGYVEFLKTVRRNNSDADILCVLGLMGRNLCESMKTAVSEYTKETMDTKVNAYFLMEQDPELGYAADWHPTEANHDRCAEEVSKIICELYGW